MSGEGSDLVTRALELEARLAAALTVVSAVMEEAQRVVADAVLAARVERPSAPVTGPRYLSVPDAAERLTLSTDHVYRLAKRGEMRAIKVGRRVAILADSLTDYCARQEVAA